MTELQLYFHVQGTWIDKQSFYVIALKVVQKPFQATTHKTAAATKERRPFSCDTVGVNCKIVSVKILKYLYKSLCT